MSIIYCVEDDESIRELILYALRGGGFEAVGFETGAALFARLPQERPALVLLDIMLPGDDGITWLKRMRAGGYSDLPVIMLTAKATEYDKVIGLDLGADDYITKPFSVMELLSRIRSVLRRCGAAKESSELLNSHGITLDYDRRRVMVNETECELTFKEFELLAYLMRNRGMVLSREKIMNVVWGFDFEGESRTVDMHIKTLRRKLEQAGAADVIKTVRSVGYKFGD